MTSHDVVDVVRKKTGEKKVGHAGTLDPLATGLLIVAVGRQSTKRLGGITRKKKTYLAKIHLGKETNTLDSEGEVMKEVKDLDPPNGSEVEKLLMNFLGKQKQIPPAHSAIKISGKKAYELARKGEKVELEPREIEIFKIKLLDYNYPILEIEVEVSKGTYIRALARDIGRKIGSGGYLEELRRTKIGEFEIEDAASLDELQKSNWTKHAIKID